MNARRITVGAAILAGVVAGVLLATSFDWTSPVTAAAGPDRAKLDAAKARRIEIRKDLERLQQSARAFTEVIPKVVQLVRPSVVSITTEKRIKTTVRHFGPDSPFGPFNFRQFPYKGPRESPIPPDLFRKRRPDERRTPQEEEFKIPGLGSGVVVREDGYILTNNHVVRQVKAGDIKVTFPDGTEHKAKKVLSDEKTDLALVKIEGGPFPALEFGRSEDLRVGEWIIAVGSPLGFGNTVTAGIVSATSTEDRLFAHGKRFDLSIIKNRYAIENYIQTDAAINPGNSGGPLVNLRGEIVGINTLIASPTRSSVGLGFAIPSATARKVVRELIAKGKVVRGHLGVTITDPARLTDRAAWQALRIRTAEELLGKYRVKRADKGVLVLGVLPNSPAEAAKMKTGDLIVEFDGVPITSVNQLRKRVAATAVGRKAKIAVMRKGEKTPLSVVIAEQPERAVAVAMDKRSHTSKKLGITVQKLTPRLARIYGYADQEGVIVVDVKKNSPAARADIPLKRNDLILEVNKQKVTNPAEFEAAVQKTADKDVALLIRRGDTTAIVIVPLD